MTAADLERWVSARPFAPFRIRMNSGRTFDVAHPELISLTYSAALLFTAAGPPWAVSERFETVALGLIESVAAIDPAPAT